MPTTTRPLSESERRDLARLSSTRSQFGAELLSGSTAFLFLFMLGTWLARFFLGPLGGRELAWVALGAATLATGVILKVHRGLAPLMARERDRHAADLEAGVASVATYEATDALSVEEFEDEGSHYYLKLADGGVLFLSGQWLHEFEAGEDEDGQPTPARFPCRRFTLERAPKSGLFLGLTPLGPAFAPSGTLPPFTDAEHEAGTVPDDGALLTIDFESLRARRAS